MVLKTKSEDNIKAAQSLIGNGYHSSSIHCSYYSCVQLIKYILLKKNGKSEKEIRVDQENSGLNSHEYLINRICQYIKKEQPMSFRDVSRILPNIKKIRNDADYREIVIETGTSNNVLSEAQEVIMILNSTL